MSEAHACCSVPNSNGNSPVFKRVLWIALVVNAAMFIVEIVASRAGDSVALQADALDFFGDAANYAISLFVVNHALSTRAKASLIKGYSMGLFGLLVIVAAGYNAVMGSQPEALTMGVVGSLALVANLFVAILLFRYRNGESNMRSIWLCTRNDVIGNLAVVAAGAGVFASMTRWPDLLVAALMAYLSITSARQIVIQAHAELRQASLTPVHLSK